MWPRELGRWCPDIAFLCRKNGRQSPSMSLVSPSFITHEIPITSSPSSASLRFISGHRCSSVIPENTLECTANPHSRERLYSASSFRELSHTCMTSRSPSRSAALPPAFHDTVRRPRPLPQHGRPRATGGRPQETRDRLRVAADGGDRGLQGREGRRRHVHKLHAQVSSRYARVHRGSL